LKVPVVIALLVVDAAGSMLALWLTFLLRYSSGWFDKPLPVEIGGPMLWLTLFWLALFALRGMYRHPVALSRFEESARVLKSVAIGILIIFIVTIDRSQPVRITRVFLLNYGLLLLLFVGFGRVAVRTFQRRLRWKGIGLSNALIVGFNEVGRRLHEQLHYYPVWGFRVVGFIDDAPPKRGHLGVHIVGRIDDLAKVIHAQRVQWILVAPPGRPDETLLRVFDRCTDQRVRFMIVADYYQMVVGLVRTIEVHGLPLVEVVPQLVELHLRLAKRLIDIAAATLWMVVLMLITPLIALAIKLDSPGPVLYRQKRVGRGGKEFTLYKFRSMVQDAEKMSGAVWAAKDDPRITRVGRFLRRTHLDELPQFYNVLKGDMSLVGPRPERPQFVEQFRDKIPLYERRLRIRPGITGWAQIRHKYDENIEDVREKTRYDLFYIDHMSLALDFRIILATTLKVIRSEGW